MAGFDVAKIEEKEPLMAPKSEDVAGEIGRVLDKGGPLMKQAQTTGLQMANRRGLLNSSMAVGAAQDEVLKVAVPIGSQQAQQNFQSNQQDRGFEQQRNLQSRDLNTRIDISNADRNTEREQRGLDRALQEKIASWNIDTDERKSASSMLTTMEQTFAAQYASIMGNTAMDAGTRERLIQNMQVERRNRINLVEQMYNIRLNWTDTGPFDIGAGSAAAPAPSPVAAPATAPALAPTIPPTYSGNPDSGRDPGDYNDPGSYGGSWGDGPGLW